MCRVSWNNYVLITGLQCTFILFINNIYVVFDELIAMVVAGMGQKLQTLLSPLIHCIH